jgi:hypothetical protein
MSEALLSLVVLMIAMAIGVGAAYAAAAPVPEPGSIALLITGAVGLGGAAWWLCARRR